MIDRREGKNEGDARSRFHSGWPRRRSVPRRGELDRSARAECWRARAEREDPPDDRRDQRRRPEAGWGGRDCGIRAGEQTAPTWLQDRRRKPAYGWNEMSEKEGGEGRTREGREGEREREEMRVAGKETRESTTEKDGERKSDGEERRRSLVALSTRAPPSSTSAPKTPTLAAKGWWRTVRKGVVIRKRE